MFLRNNVDLIHGAVSNLMWDRHVEDAPDEADSQRGIRRINGVRVMLYFAVAFRAWSTYVREKGGHSILGMFDIGVLRARLVIAVWTRRRQNIDNLSKLHRHPAWEFFIRRQQSTCS